MTAKTISKRSRVYRLIRRFVDEILSNLRTWRGDCALSWIMARPKRFSHLTREFSISDRMRDQALMLWGPLGLKEFSIDLAKRKSDTLFVLGSGPSINDITVLQWMTIRMHDSFGFNRWYHSHFVPDYYMFELPRNHEDQESFVRNLCHIWPSYSETIKIIKPISPFDRIDLSTLPKQLIPDLYYCQSYFIGGADLCEYRNRLQAAEKLSQERQESFPSLKHQTRASLDQVINFGIDHEYREIVLCGVDLLTPNYFFEEQGIILRAGLELPRVNPHNMVHRTIDPSLGALTINKIVEVQRDIARRRGCQLYVGNSSSALHPILPAYLW